MVVGGQLRLRPGTPTEPQAYAAIPNPKLDLGRYGPIEECEL